MQQKGLEEMVNIQHGALLQPYYTLMFNLAMDVKGHCTVCQLLVIVPTSFGLAFYTTAVFAKSHDTCIVNITSSITPEECQYSFTLFTHDYMYLNQLLIGFVAKWLERNLIDSTFTHSLANWLCLRQNYDYSHNNNNCNIIGGAL